MTYTRYTMKKKSLKSIFADDPEILALIEAKKYEDQAPALEELRAFFKGDRGARGDKGDPGKDGYTPEKFKDYFTEEEITWMMENMENMVYARITTELKKELQGKDGRDGKDGDSVDVDALLSVLLKKLPKPREINEEALQKKVLTLLISKIPTVDDFITEIKKKRLLHIRDINGARLDNPDKKASGGFNMNDQRWHGAGGTTSGGANVTTQYLLTATQDGDDVEIDLTQLTNYATLDQILVVYRNNIPQTDSINFSVSGSTLTIIGASAEDVYNITYSYT